MADELTLCRPLPRAAAKRRSALARRGRWTLAGKMVGLLDNTKEQGDVILETVAHALRERLRRRESHHPSAKSILEARDRRADRRDGEGGAGGRRRRRRMRVLHVVQCARHNRIRKTRHPRDGVSHADVQERGGFPVPRQRHGRPSVHRAAASDQQSAGRDARCNIALYRPDGAPANSVIGGSAAVRAP